MSHRKGWISILVLAGGVSAGTVRATVVADYRDDFAAHIVGAVSGVTAAVFADGWAYLWNAPTNWTPDAGVTGDMSTGVLGDPTSYIPLLYTSDSGTPWTSDSDTVGSNHNPDRYARATASGGHPGAGSEINNLGNTNSLGLTIDRCVIFAYTLQADDGAGMYALTNTLVTRTSTSGDGDRIYIHINDDAILQSFYVPPATTTPLSFDLDLGALSVGDTIYVAVGTDGPGDGTGGAGNDGFTIDFSIDRAIPEPATGLLMLSGLFLRKLRRRPC